MENLGNDSTGRYFITNGLLSLKSNLVKVALKIKNDYVEDENEVVSCLRPTMTN